MTNLDLPIDDVIGVWYDLERALAGKHGYGGDVAEIYTYRLVPPSRRHHPQDADMACVAGKNMTLLLRRFVELHEAVVAIEEGAGFRPIDLAAEEVPPFLRRVHLRVSPIAPRAVAPSIHELREAIAKTADHAIMLMGMLDELAASRGKERLHADARDPADTSDLPPEAPRASTSIGPSTSTIWSGSRWRGMRSCRVVTLVVPIGRVSSCSCSRRSRVIRDRPPNFCAP